MSAAPKLDLSPKPDIDGLESELPPDEVYEEQECLISSLDEMDRHAELLEYWQRRKAWLDNLYQAKLARVKEWHDQQTKRFAQRIAWHEYGLESFLKLNRLQRASLPTAEVSLVAGRPRLEVSDVDQLVAWALEDLEVRGRLIRTRHEPDKEAIKKFTKQPDGEIPPGTDLVTSPPRLRVRFHGEADTE